MEKLVVTGASGFVGRRLLELAPSRWHVVPLSLRNGLDGGALVGASAVVHLAALVHQMGGAPDDAYRRVNVELTRTLGEAARAAGVATFVFLSSVKVYGAECSASPLTERSPTVPVDGYGRSKLEAEAILREMESERFRVGVVRSPLVYGPGVKGNVRRLLALADSPWPLPLAGIENRRSMIGVGNLADLVLRCASRRASGTFLASDGPPWSTSQLVDAMRSELGRPRRLFRLPRAASRLCSRLAPAIYSRLFSDLELDATWTAAALEWAPRFPPREELQRAVESYRLARRPRTGSR